MFGKTILITILLLTTSCARPKYENSMQNTDGHSAEKVSDCKIRFNTSSLCVIWKWEVPPTASTNGSIQFKIVRGNILDDSPMPFDLTGDVSLVLWMPSMGHGSSPTSVEKIDTGSFRATNVFFVMPGEWELKFQIRNGNSILDEAVDSIRI